jgi:hypothetical protein
MWQMAAGLRCQSAVSFPSSLALAPLSLNYSIDEIAAMIIASGEAFTTEGGPATLVQAANNFIATDNPGFVDWQRMNFALAPDAPVFKRIPGFKVFDFDRIGARAPHGQVETMDK